MKELDGRPAADFIFYARAAGILVAGMGGLVILGWALNSPVLKSLSPAWVTMKANTAAGFLLIGSALALLSSGEPRQPKHLAIRFCAGVAAALGALTLCEHFFRWDAGIDQILFQEALGAVGTSAPGRMAPTTAFNFTVAGAVLVLLDSGTPRNARLAQRFVLPIALISLLALGGYLHGVKALYGLLAYTQMALPTAAAFLVFCLGALCARPDEGFMAMACAPSAGGAVLRRLVPASYLVLLSIGWLCLTGQRQGLYGIEFAIALFSFLGFLILASDLYRTAGILHQADLERRRLHQDLEVKVRERTAELQASNAELQAQSDQRQRAVEEQEKLRAQLLQSQKMEAIGRLAGGVSHDFNNLLTAIGGYCHFLLENLRPGDPNRDDVAEIQRAGERAAALTRQLLAFSRQQVFELRVLDCNAVVRGMERMLRRLIGEDLELSCRLDEGLWEVKADPGQLEQVLMNLVLNARDAMPGGGKVTLETANVELAEDYARMHMEVKPGPYVLLSVADTGHGMDAKTMDRLFEPFFTTKEQGKGTGLGLAVVYGIVKQSGGNIFVYSEPGHGTTFNIYLPRTAEAEPGFAPAPADAKPAGGPETVLLVEDDELVRKFAQRVLARNGYAVLAAETPEEALRACAEHPGPIHLMLTDVVMPQMHGGELSRRAAAARPDMKVIFMSGYTETAVIHRNDLGPDAVFLQKPLSPAALARGVRAALDAG